MRFKIAFFLCLLLIIPAFSRAVIIDKITAIVNDDVITQSEVFAIGKLKLHLSGLPAADDVLHERIDHHLVLQQIAKQPPVLLTEEDVQKEIQTFAQLHGGMDELSKFINSAGMNYSDLEKEVRDQLSIRHFIADRFRPFVNVTLEEAEKYYEEVYKPRLQVLNQEVPPFPETFNDVQNLMVEERMQARIKDWLNELRRSATINIKD
jgi:parvulin-like peptidyl-prolyl isomerase